MKTKIKNYDKTTFKVQILVLLILLTFNITHTYAKKIIPDAQFPIITKFPNVYNKQTIITNFQFSKTSIGLGINQYIGLVFPVNYGSILKLSEESRIEDSEFISVNPGYSSLLSQKTLYQLQQSPKFKCLLTKNERVIQTQAVLSLDEEDNNIAFCKLTSNIKLESGYSYSLTITLKEHSFSIIPNLGLLTSTANGLNRIIIDSIPFIGNTVLRSPYLEDYDSSLLKITSLNLKSSADECVENSTIKNVSSDYCNYIYPQDSFDLKILFTVTEKIVYNKYTIVLEIPNDLITFSGLAPNIEILYYNSTDTTESTSDTASSTSSDSSETAYTNLNKEYIESSNSFTDSNIYLLPISNTDNLDLVTNINTNSNKYTEAYINTLNNASTKATKTKITSDTALNNSYCSKESCNFVIKNIKQNLKPNLYYILVLKQLKANNIVNQTRSVSIKLFENNFYNLLSYSYSSGIVISQGTVNYGFSSKLTSGISHPDYWDIFSNSVWPIKFIFNSNIAIPKDSFLVIQHVNAKDSINNLTFIASTCDLSDVKDNGDNLFPNNKGKRPVCFPLRSDFLYPERSSDQEYNGSGFFFRLPEGLIKREFYSVRIFIIAENCGSTTNPTLADNSKSYVNFNFKYSIYTRIESHQTNENRFNKDYLIAESDAITMYGKCYNTLLTDNISGRNYINFNESYGKVLNFPTSNDTDGLDILLFKEMNDFDLGEVTSSTQCTNCFLDNVTSSSNSFDSDYKAFFYASEDNSQIEQSYFLLKFSITAKTSDNTDTNNNYNANYHFADEIPMPVFRVDSSPNSLYFQKGKLRFLFSKNWFTVGDSLSDCYFSWASKISSLTTNSQTSLFNTASITGELNYLTVDGETIDKNLSYIPENYNSDLHPLPEELIADGNETAANQLISPFKITSNFNNVQSSTANEQIYWTLFKDIIKPIDLATETVATLDAYYFSTCIKTTALIPYASKSLYSFIDFQAQWLGISAPHARVDSELLVNSNYYVTRVQRFFKLLPELGNIFNQDLKKLNIANDSLLYTHQVKGFDSVNNFICLLELNSNIVSVGLSKGTLVIFLNNLLLLETDYEIDESMYPSGPVPLNVDVYALPSQMNISSISNLSQKLQNSDDNIIEKRIKEFEKNTYYQYLSSLVILVRNSFYSSSDTQDIKNLFIPHYCPISVTSNEYINYNSNKNIYVTFLSIDFLTYKSIGPINNQITLNNKSYYSIEIPNPNSDVTRLNMQFNNYSSFSLVNKNKQLLINKTYSYTDCGDTSINYDAKFSKYSTFILLLNKNINIGINKNVYNNSSNSDDTIKIVLDNENLSPVIVSFKEYKFYAFGFSFNTAVFYSSKGDNNSFYSDVSYTNITRPSLLDISEFIKNSEYSYSYSNNVDFSNENNYNGVINNYTDIKSFGLNNYIAFFCINSHTDMITNKISSKGNSIDSSVKGINFNNEYFKITLSDDYTVLLENADSDYSDNYLISVIYDNYDNQSELYNKNKLYKLTFDLKFHYGYLSNSTLEITTTAMLSSSVCGVKFPKTESVSDCVIKNSNGKYNISCYLDTDFYLKDKIEISEIIDIDSYSSNNYNQISYSNTLTIICYNIEIKNDSFAITEIMNYINLSNPLLSSTENKLIFSKVSDNSLMSLDYIIPTYDTNNKYYDKTNSLIPDIEAKIEEVSYEHSNNLDGIGVLNIVVSLNKSFPFASILNIYGDLSGLYIEDTIQKCFYSFIDDDYTSFKNYNNYEIFGVSESVYTGDSIDFYDYVFLNSRNSNKKGNKDYIYYIDNCKLNDLNQRKNYSSSQESEFLDSIINTPVIQVQSKNFILNTEYSLPQKLTIKIFPVKIIDLFNKTTASNDINNKNSNYSKYTNLANKYLLDKNYFKLELLIKDSSSPVLIKTNYVEIPKLTKTISTDTPLLKDQKDLCNIVSIIPKLVGAYSTWVIEVFISNTLFNNNTIIKNNLYGISELSVFLPFSIPEFSLISNLICYHNDDLVNCDYNKDLYILNVGLLSSNIKFNLNSVHYIKLVGVINPEIQGVIDNNNNNEDLFFIQTHSQSTDKKTIQKISSFNCSLNKYLNDKDTNSRVNLVTGKGQFKVGTVYSSLGDYSIFDYKTNIDKIRKNLIIDYDSFNYTDNNKYFKIEGKIKRINLEDLEYEVVNELYSTSSSESSSNSTEKDESSYIDIDALMLNNKKILTLNHDIYSPREKQDIILRFIPDISDLKVSNSTIADSFTNLEALEIPNNPVIILTLPSQFNQHLNSVQNLISSDLDEYQLSYQNKIEINTFILIKDKIYLYKSLSLKSLHQENNRITITLNEDSITIYKETAYIEVFITNVFSPIEEIISSSIDITLVNNDYSYIFKSFSNYDSSKETIILENELDNSVVNTEFIKYYKGLIYKYNDSLDYSKSYENTYYINPVLQDLANGFTSISYNTYYENKYKRIIDVVQFRDFLNSDSSYSDLSMDSSLPNKIVLRQGRFVQSFFNLRNNYYNHFSASTDISIKYGFESNHYYEKNNLQLFKEKYNINTSTSNLFSFYIGVSCLNKLRGSIFVLFDVDNKEDFFNIIPVEAFIDSQSKGYIKFSFTNYSSSSSSSINSSLKSSWFSNIKESDKQDENSDNDTYNITNNNSIIPTIKINSNSYNKLKFTTTEIPFNSIFITTNLSKNIDLVYIQNHEIESLNEYYDINELSSISERYNNDDEDDDNDSDFLEYENYNTIKKETETYISLKNKYNWFRILSKDNMKIITIHDDGLTTNKKELILFSQNNKCFDFELNYIYAQKQINNENNSYDFVLKYLEKKNNEMSYYYNTQFNNSTYAYDSKKFSDEDYNSKNPLDIMIENTSAFTLQQDFYSSFEIINKYSNDYDSFPANSINFYYKTIIKIPGLLFCQCVCTDLDFYDDYLLLKYMFTSSMENEKNRIIERTKTNEANKEYIKNLIDNNSFSTIYNESSYVRLFGKYLTGDNEIDSDLRNSENNSNNSNNKNNNTDTEDNSDEAGIKISFNNLKRNLKYKIKCYLSTLDVEIKDKTVIAVVLNANITNNNNFYLNNTQSLLDINDKEKKEFDDDDEIGIPEIEFEESLSDSKHFKFYDHIPIWNYTSTNSTSNNTNSNNSTSSDSNKTDSHYDHISEIDFNITNFYTDSLQNTSCIQFVFNTTSESSKYINDDTTSETNTNVLFHDKFSQYQNEKSLGVINSNTTYSTYNYFNIRLLSYCQSIFAKYGFKDNGCIKCIDQYKQTAPGFKSEDSFNELARYSCKDNYINSKDYSNIKDEIKVSYANTIRNLRRNLKVESINKNNVYDSKRLLTVKSSIESGKRVYSVCAIQQNNCSTNLHKFSQTYSSLIDKIVGDLNSSKSIIKNLNLKENISQLATTSTTKVDDLINYRMIQEANNYLYTVLLTENTKPDINKLSITNISYSASNKNVSFKLSFLSRVSCILSVILNKNKSSSLLVSKEEMSYCSSSLMISCYVSKAGVDVSSTTLNFNDSLSAAYYSIFAMCYNDVVFPVLESDVKLISSFTVSASNSTSTNSTSTNETSNFSYFMSVSYLVFFIVFFIFVGII